jgi:transposase
MIKSRQVVRKVIELTITGKLSPKEASALLESSVRTVHNYVKRYSEQGPNGLIDHRCGHYRKVSPEMRDAIVECRMLRPQRSARWIRNWLKLTVSPETVRQVLAKHHLKHGGINRSNTSPAAPDHEKRRPFVW